MNRRGKKRKLDEPVDLMDDDSDPDYEPGLTDEEDYRDKYPELQKADRKQMHELELTTQEVEMSQPNIFILLNTKMLRKDKADLLELFEAYMNIPEEISLDKIELKKTYNETFKRAIIKYKQYKKYTKKEHEEFSKKLEDLEQYDEKEEMKYDILNLDTNDSNRQKIYNEYRRMLNMSFSDDELPKLKNWLKWALKLPHDTLKTIPYKKRELTQFLQKVSMELNEKLYGMEKVKEQILIFLNSRIVNPRLKKCSLGLIGRPGTGKTYITRVLADILNYPFEQISLGGIRSPEYLKGHQYTYIASEPGEIVKCLCRMKAKNGILFFDEYDKISENKEVCSALLHITDSVQNDRYSDNFLSGITIDLSYLWFFYSMNERPSDDALADRIFYIEIPSYTQKDKFFIVKDYLIRRAVDNVGWNSNSLIFNNDAIEYLIERVSPPEEAGIRTLEYYVFTIANKLNFLFHHQTGRGKLNGFHTSFELGRKIKFPFIIQKKDIDVLIQ